MGAQLCYLLSLQQDGCLHTEGKGLFQVCGFQDYIGKVFF